MGMMANVRVSFTIVAWSSALDPGCMPSHAAAAAVTDEVSFTAVPANRPKPSLVMPSALPSDGKIRAASTLNRKMTEMAWATSLSCAYDDRRSGRDGRTHHQMDEPTPMSVEISEGREILLP